MELIFVKQDSTEWKYIWDFVANHPINEGLQEPRTAVNEGEAWQYMGSFKNNNKVIHEFRHRFHPKTMSLYNITFKASDNFTIEQIDKSIIIK